ncbi:MAG: L-rhamnose mutarotase [Bacteroidaceae bacterium]|nr:L-rhamnose mutarotase [Bacteroidaceae bacterium]
MDSTLSGYTQKRFAEPVKRYCQTLDLRDDPTLIETYRQLHSREGVWQETLQAIRAVGILEMEIYLLGTRLFMIVEVPLDFNWDEAMQRMASLPKQKEWEQLTGQYQQAKPGATSDQKWQLMERIFHLYET